MGVFSILVDSIGLAIGSLLAAGLLSCGAWWLADRIHRPRVATALLVVLYIGMLVSPLERSLFVRMMAVFGFVAAILIYFIGGDDASDMDASVEGQATQGGTGKQ